MPFEAAASFELRDAAEVLTSSSMLPERELLCSWLRISADLISWTVLCARNELKIIVIVFGERRIAAAQSRIEAQFTCRDALYPRYDSMLQMEAANDAGPADHSEVAQGVIRSKQ